MDQFIHKNEKFAVKCLHALAAKIVDRTNVGGDDTQFLAVSQLALDESVRCCFTEHFVLESNGACEKLVCRSRDMRLIFTPPEPISQISNLAVKVEVTFRYEPDGDWIRAKLEPMAVEFFDTGSVRGSAHTKIESGAHIVTAWRKQMIKILDRDKFLIYDMSRDDADTDKLPDEKDETESTSVTQTQH